MGTGDCGNSCTSCGSESVHHQALISWMRHSNVPEMKKAAAGEWQPP